MAKIRVKKPAPPATLTMNLFGPGMTILHRAGLGGLACTLKYIERAWRAGILLDADVPGEPWKNDLPPWSIDAHSVTLDFASPEEARPFLKRLFAIAFDLKDGLIYLPGQYVQEPSLAVRAELQAGLTLSFLQHGRVRQLDKKSSIFQYDPVGDGRSFVTIEYKKCRGYKHQDGWKDLTDNKGSMQSRNVEVIGPLNPGAVVRHVAFTAATKIVDSVHTVLPLYFSIVGCLALSVNRGVGVLIAPDVDDLEAFVWDRPAMTPRSPRECRITGLGDAALQAQVRVRSRALLEESGVPAMYAMKLAPTNWASQQKSRVATLLTYPGLRFATDSASPNDDCLSMFEIALAELAPRIAITGSHLATMRLSEAKADEQTNCYWSDSIIRPLVADNLAAGRPWYSGFIDLMTHLDPVSKRPLRDRLFFEKEGLHAMTERIPWQDRGESAVVRAVHEAIRRRFGQIRKENENQPAAMKNRFKGEYDRWRLAFCGAKTAEQFRHSLCDLFSRSGFNSALQKEWQEVLPMLDGERWQQTRDLALLGLASYSGQGTKAIEQEMAESEANL